MSARLTERQRWVQLHSIAEPTPTVDGAMRAKVEHQQLMAAIRAIHKIGRVVRIEPMKYGNGFVVKARRA